MADSRPLLLRDFRLENSLHCLEFFLTSVVFIGRTASLTAAFAAFCVFGIMFPSLAFWLSSCDAAQGPHCVTRFDVYSHICQALITGAALACTAYNLREHGLRGLLFADRKREEITLSGRKYIREITDFFSLFNSCMLCCIIGKAIRELWRFNALVHESHKRAVAVLCVSNLSWVYLTAVFLSTCFLFKLVCNLQLMHIKDFNKSLEEDTSDPSQLLKEHTHLQKNLGIISQRSQYFLMSFLLVLASQIITLIEAFGYKWGHSLFNVLEFQVVSVVVPLVGILPCLLAAIKISETALDGVAVASKHNVFLTFTASSLSQQRGADSNRYTDDKELLKGVDDSELMESSNPSNSPQHIGRGTSGNFGILESTECFGVLASQLVSNLKRQSFVTYLQSSPCGITVHGWVIDHQLKGAIFFLLPAVLLFLGKSLILSTE